MMRPFALFVAAAATALPVRAAAQQHNALGLTSKATDWAPEVRVMLSFPVR
jgi:hypothetical protein